MAQTLYDPDPKRRKGHRRRKMSALQRRYFGKGHKPIRRRHYDPGKVGRKSYRVGPRHGVYWSGATKRRYDPGIMGKISSTLGKFGMPVAALLAFAHQSVAKTPPANLEGYPQAVYNQITNPQLPTSVGGYWDRIKNSMKLWGGLAGWLYHFIPGVPFKTPVKKVGTGLVAGTLAGAVIDPDAPQPVKKPTEDKDIYRPIWSGEGTHE